MEASELQRSRRELPDTQGTFYDRGEYMTDGDGVQLYFSLEAMTAIKRAEEEYIRRETGLTLDTLYNDNDFEMYNLVGREIIPEALGAFLLLLITSFPALEVDREEEEARELERGTRLIDYFLQLIGEEGDEDGEEL